MDSPVNLLGCKVGLTGSLDQFWFFLMLSVTYSQGWKNHDLKKNKKSDFLI